MNMLGTGKQLVSITFIILTTVGSNISTAAASASCACPPFYCISSEGAKAKQAKKEAAIRDGLPARLAAYFDKLPNCMGCVEKAPSSPVITWRIDQEAYEKKYGREPGFKGKGAAWSRNLEQQLRDEMREGVVTKFSITLATVPCRCCPQNNNKEPVSDKLYFKDSSGWDSELEVHAGAGEIFTNPNQLGEDPKDLTTLPKLYQRPTSLVRPEIEPAPPVRVVQPLCPDCQPVADEYNQLGSEINSLNKNIAKKKRELSIINQAIKGVRLEQDGIGLLADTASTRKMNKDLEEELEQRTQDRTNTEKKLQNAQNSVQEKEQQLQAILKRLQDCDKKCAATSERTKKIALITVLSGAALLALSNNSGDGNTTDDTSDTDSTGTAPATDPAPETNPVTSSPDGNYNTNLTVASNLANHPVLLQQLILSVEVLNATIRLTQLNSNPNFPSQLTGSIAADGSFSASGSGTYSGFATLFQITGTILALQQSMNYLLNVGGNGSLPGGQPITYNGSGAKQ